MRYSLKYNIYFAIAVAQQVTTMIKEYTTMQAALMLVICNAYLDDDCRMNEGQIKSMLYDLMDMMEE